MQDPLQNSSEDKHYFDIKGPAKPDPTSRPVINNEPLQTDPMVSVTSPTPSEGEADAEPIDGNVETEDPTSQSEGTVTSTIDNQTSETISGVEDKTEVPQSDQTEPGDTPVPDLPGGSNPDAVEYKTPEPDKTSEEATTPPADSDAAPTVELSSVETESEKSSDDSVVPGDTPKVEHIAEATQDETRAEDSSEDTGHATDTDAVTSEVTSLPDSPAAAAVPPAVVEPSKAKKAGKFKQDLGLKIVIAILILILIGITAFFVYKYKTGQ